MENVVIQLRYSVEILLIKMVLAIVVVIVTIQTIQCMNLGLLLIRLREAWKELA